MKKPAVKTLEEILSETFRSVRWAESDGQAVCPSCHAADDVRDGYEQQRRLKHHPRLRSYFCSCCKYPFSDLTKTVLERTTRPLALWAFLILGGENDALIEPGKPQQWKREYLRQMREKSKVSLLADAWAKALGAAGVTVEQLAAELKASPRWWGEQSA